MWDIAAIKERVEDLGTSLFRSYRTILVTAAVSGSIAIICRNPFQEHLPSYAMGDIARKDIRALENIRVTDEELTEKRRSAASELILNVYDFDPEAKDVFVERLSKAFDLISGQTSQRSEKYKSSFEEALGIS
ncbi:MAG: hypothetical protein JWQ35_1343, partial [Bacteriovoracaceae bacterium]|nr:hypothetical protein [Bacteriovoracaceae bacterium]